jgi:hypothetical protein
MIIDVITKAINVVRPHSTTYGTSSNTIFLPPATHSYTCQQMNISVVRINMYCSVLEKFIETTKNLRGFNLRYFCFECVYHSGSHTNRPIRVFVVLLDELV